MRCWIKQISEAGQSVSHEGDFDSLLDQIGEMPTPPYIHEKLEDQSQYQTVYAQVRGSAAAPTAGLHFTPQLMEDMKKRGADIRFVTLHVGIGPSARCLRKD